MTASGDGRLAGRVALVTGGASGIGRAAALRLARDGAAVIVADRDAAGAEAAAAAIVAAGDDGAAHPLDVTSGEAWAAVMDGIARARGRLDIAVQRMSPLTVRATPGTVF